MKTRLWRRFLAGAVSAALMLSGTAGAVQGFAEESVAVSDSQYMAEDTEWGYADAAQEEILTEEAAGQTEKIVSTSGTEKSGDADLVIEDISQETEANREDAQEPSGGGTETADTEQAEMPETTPKEETPSETVTEAGTELSAETVTEAGTDPSAETMTEAVPGEELSSEIMTEAGSEPSLETMTEAAAGEEPSSEAMTEAGSEPSSETMTEAASEGETSLETGTEAASEEETAPETGTETESEEAELESEAGAMPTADVLTSGSYEYTVSGQDVTITKYTGSGGAVTIPETIGGYTVMSIGDSAFSGCTSLTSVTFPKTITQVGNSAFSGCTSLVQVTFQENETAGYKASIGDFVFSGCRQLTQVKFSSNVTGIGSYVFRDCTALTTLELPEKLEYLGADMITGTSIRELTIPRTLARVDYHKDGYNGSHAPFMGAGELKKLIFESGMEQIPAYTAWGSSVESVVIPDTVTGTGAGAFQNCTNLGGVELPAGLTELGVSAFRDCSSLPDVELPDNMTTIAEAAFSGCSSLTSVKLPEKLETIGNDAFSGCISLPSVTFPQTITQVGNSAFSGCTSLTQVMFQENETAGYKASIGNSAFSGCKKLEQVDFSSNVTEIGSYVFGDCSALVTLELPKKLEYLGSDVLSGTSIKELTIPRTLTRVDYHKDGYNGSHAPLMGAGELKKLIFESGMEQIPGYMAFSSGVENVVIPDTVTNIGGSAFEGCGSLPDVVLPDNITTISAGTFGDCSSLTSVKLPEKLETIGNDAFSGCTSLPSVTFPKTITQVGNSAFYGCTSLGQVTFQENETAGYKVIVGNNAFSGCKKLEQVDFSSNVTEIGSYVFRDCSALVTLELPKKLESLGSDVLSGTSIRELTIPKTLTRVDYHEDAYKYSYAPLIGAGELKSLIFESGMKQIPAYTAWGSSVESVVIPDTVTDIGANAFEECSALSEVFMSKNLKNIGSFAFNGCHVLINLELPETLETIGGSAFQNCTSLKEAIFPPQIREIGSYAYNGCTLLKHIAFQENERVGYTAVVRDGAFSGCIALAQVEFSRNVTELGSRAFNACRDLVLLELPEELKSLGVNMINATAIEELVIPKTLETVGHDGDNGPLAGAKKLNRILFDEGLEQIPAYMAAGSSVECAVIPESVAAIGDRAFWNCDKLEIYGYRNSYAETYANENNIPFHEVGIAKNMTAEEILKKLNLANLLNDVKISEGKITGPMLTVAGETFPLFTLDASMDLELSDSVQAKVDMENKSVQVLIGFDKFEGSAELDPAKNKTTYWSESYKQVKELYTGITGNEVDTTKLWNKFSKLRGRLKKLDATMMFSVDASAVGYMEFGFASGEFSFREGGVVLAAGFNVEVKQNLPVFPAAYAAFSLKMDLGGKLTLVREAVLNYSLSLEMMLALEAALGLRIGSKKLSTYVEGGFEGKLWVGLKLPAKTLPKALTVNIGGGVYFNSQVLGFDGPDYRYDFESTRIYPRTSAIMLFDGADVLAVDTAQLDTASRDYLNTAKQELSLTGTDDVPDSIYEQTGVYPYSSPKIAELDNGTKLMIWIGDTGEKDKVNRTSLMYSVYQNGWSEPKTLFEAGGLNDYPDMYSDGQKAYIVWQRTAAPLSADATLADAVKATNVYYITYADGVFTEPEMLGESGNQTYEMMQRVASGEGKTAVVWIENSENDPFMVKGTNSIRMSERNGGTWTEKTLVSGLSAVGALAVEYVNGDPAVLYEVSDQETPVVLSWNGTEKRFAGENAHISGGILYYEQEEELYSYDIRTGRTTGSALNHAGDYTVVSGGDVTYLLSVKSGGTTGELYGSLYDNVTGTWGNMVQLTDYGKYIRSYSAEVDASGQLIVVMNVLDPSPDGNGVTDQASVLAVCLNAAYDVSVSDVFYDEEQAAPGAPLSMNLQVKNNSLKTIETLETAVKGADGADLGGGPVSCHIEPGETAEVSCLYTLPEDLTKHTVTVSAQTTGETNLADNSMEVTVGYGDLALQDIYLAGTAEEPQIAGTITNTGYAPMSGGTVSVFRESAEGEALGSAAVPALDPGESSTFGIALDPAQLDVDFMASGNTLYVHVAAADTDEEARLENNSSYYLIKPESERGLGLNRNTLTLTPGGTETLKVVYTDTADAAQEAVWTSADPAVAAVENGVVTAVAEGQTTITVRVGSLWADCVVTVSKAVRVTGVLLREQSVRLLVNEKYTLTASVLPENADNQKISWESDNEAVATVSAGTVTGISVGTAVITAVSEDGAKYASCQVRVTSDREAYYVAVFEGGEGASGAEPEAASAKGGQIITLPQNTFQKGTAKFICWNDGQKDYQPGAEYRMPYRDVTFTAKWEGDRVLVSEIRFNVTELHLEAGETADITASVLPEDAENKELRWTSSNEAAVRVENGRVTAVAEGTAVITASSTDGSSVSASCEVSVGGSGETEKKERTITGQTYYEKKVSDRSFQLDAALSEGTGSLNYSSSNRSVVMVDEEGFAAILGAGTAVITVTAPATEEYRQAELQITVVVTEDEQSEDDESEPGQTEESDEPGSNQPGGNTPGTSGSDQPDGNTPETSGSDQPGGNTPETSGSSQPGGNNPEASGSSQPGGNNPDTPLPGETETKPCSHQYGPYVVTDEPTVLKTGTKTRTCQICGDTETETVAKLRPSAKLNANKLPMKKKQSTTKIKISGLAKGDYIVSWKSSNTKIVKVSKKGKITAQKKTGKAVVTVTLASGLKKKITITVQNANVKTTKISGLSRKLTLKKGKTAVLKPVITPLTSQDKVTYKSSNKKIATVSAKGVIKAKKPGKTKITVTSGKKKFVVTVTVKK